MEDKMIPINPDDKMKENMELAATLEAESMRLHAEAERAKRRAQSFGTLSSQLPLEILYRKEGQDEGETRVIDEPELFEGEDGALFVKAYCRLRKGERTFRLDRILRLKVVND